MRLILVRHGQSEGNAAGIIQGHTEFGLTELGLIQAKATAERLAREKVDRIASSPLRRAVQTAREVGLTLGLPIEEEPALREYGMGEASGLTGQELRERFPHIVGAYARGERPVFPGEEGRDVFRARLADFLARVQQNDETVIAVAHGGVISALCYDVLGIDAARRGMFMVANCSITEFVRDRSGRLTLARHNDTCHLDGLVTEADRG